MLSRAYSVLTDIEAISEPMCIPYSSINPSTSLNLLYSTELTSMAGHRMDRHDREAVEDVAPVLRRVAPLVFVVSVSVLNYASIPNKRASSACATDCATAQRDADWCVKACRTQNT